MSNLSGGYSFEDVKNKWENSSWGKKLIVQKRRASLNDFDRFKVMLAKIKVRHPILNWFTPVYNYSLAYTNVFCMNRGEVLSGKSLRSSRRLPRLSSAMLSFWFQVGSAICFDGLRARISTTV